MNSTQTTQMSATPSAQRQSRAVYTIVEKPGREPFWLRIGWCNTNRDGSFNIHLDAIPINGKLQVRDWQPREERERPVEGDAAHERFM
jgi:hypothetical protein